MPETVVTLPTLHADQVRAFWAYRKYPRLILRAGRRWGKTALVQTIACDCAIKGGYVGWFVPAYKISSEAFNEMAEWLAPVKASSSKIDGVIRTTTGGRIDFWTLDSDRAGRSRKYSLAVCDEAAFNKPNFGEVWERAIEPTLLDKQGRAIFSSNTNGKDTENTFYNMWRRCENITDAEREGEKLKEGWYDFWAPTEANPTIPEPLPGETEPERMARHAAMMAKLRADNMPLVFDQEYMARFCDFSGVAFFSMDKMMDPVSELPVEYPPHCDAVFAVIDTATKTGRENDGTAVTYWARTFDGFGQHPLVLLDYDIQQIEGSLLEAWLPTVFQRLEGFALQCRARQGPIGAFIEDKSSGMVLLQQALRRGWPAHPIDTKLTAMGKVERAVSISGYFYRGFIKISGVAHERVVTYKGATANHFIKQVTGFRVDDKDPHRADDLVDCLTYSASIALGNNEGW